MDRQVEFVYTDPLAEQYAQQIGTTNYEEIVPLFAENLPGPFAPTSFDVVFARNSLDHGLDPVLACRKAAEMLKPHGIMVLSHHYAAGLREYYSGLHQWNFVYIDGHVMVLDRNGNRSRSWTHSRRVVWNMQRQKSSGGRCGLTAYFENSRRT